MANYLYNGYEFPALPERDEEIYPYVSITKGAGYHALAGQNYDLAYLCFSGAPAEMGHSLCLSELTPWVTYMIDYLNGETDWQPYSEGCDSSPCPIILYRHPIIYANHDVLNEDGTLYLAASEPVPVVQHVTESKGDGYALYSGVKVLASEVPDGAESIPLDGMNVIEWDGDTTGLTVVGGMFYKVSDVFINKTDIIGCFYAMVVNGELQSGRIEEVEASSDDNFTASGGLISCAIDGYEVNGVVVPETGLYFNKYNDSLFVSLLAYTPATTEKKEYTIIYQTQYGVEPESKTITVLGDDGYVLTEGDLPELYQNGYLFRGWTYSGVPVNANRLIYLEGDTIVLTASWEFMVPMIDRTSLVLGYVYGHGLVAMDEINNSEPMYFKDLWAEFDPFTASATVADGESAFASSELETYSFGELSGKYTNGHLYLDTTEEVLE